MLKLYREVRRRAGNRCEYCRLPEQLVNMPFAVDHVIARKHGGRTQSLNLALSCSSCNGHKGTDLTGLDPKSRRIVRLFNPRRDQWAWHFWWAGPKLVGRTSIGRTTVALLDINGDHLMASRIVLMDAGLWETD